MSGGVCEARSIFAFNTIFRVFYAIPPTVSRSEIRFVCVCVCWKIAEPNDIVEMAS